MLELPNLDDRDFDELMADARSLISRIYPEWTNHNPHDPGITLLELMAWLVEMQQYYLNRIPDRNIRKFLKLLGVTPRGVQPARTFIAFDQLEQRMRLPEGTQVAAGDLLFETSSSVDLQPVRLVRLFVSQRGALRDVTTTLQDAQIGVQPFGRPAEKGNGLYVGFNGAVAGPIRLAMQVKYDEGPTPVRIPLGSDAYVAPATLQWQYFGHRMATTDSSGASVDTVDAGGDKSSGADWHDLEVEVDDSFNFAQSGVLQFQLRGQTVATTLGTMSQESLHFIRCMLVDGTYMESPRVQRMALNAVEVMQQETVSAHWEFTRTSDQRDVTLEHALAVDGEVEVQVEVAAGEWATWKAVPEPEDGQSGSSDEVYAFVRDANEGTLTVRLGAAVNRLSAHHRIRVIVFHPRLGSDRAMGMTTGLPNCQVVMPYREWSTFTVQVGRVKNGRPIWEDWQYVEDFSASGPQDKHYTFDDDGDYLVFGDNERGLLPAQWMERNVRVLALRHCRGVAGNIQRDQIRTVIAPTHAQLLRVTNTAIGDGGQDAETLGRMQVRMERDLKTVRSLVTTDDYETTVRETPGLRVRHVQVLPLWVEGLRDYPNRTEPGHVTIVVSPYGDTPYTTPNAAFLETARRHLMDYRLLGIELHVAGPRLIRINVTTTIVVEPTSVDEQETVRKVIDGYITNPEDTRNEMGVELGRRLYAGDVQSVLHRIPGVVFVQEARFEYQGQGVTVTSDGDIVLPPNGLAYPGSHQITLVSRLDLFPEGV